MYHYERCLFGFPGDYMYHYERGSLIYYEIILFVVLNVIKPLLLQISSNYF